MIVTKFTHACVRVDDGDRSVVIDPGFWSELDQALDGVGAVLISHEHPDHVDVEAVRAAAKRDSDLRIWAPGNVAEQLSDLGDQVVRTLPGEEFEAGGFAVATYGGQHAVVHPSIPVIENIAYWVEGVYHPGDSFTIPTKPTDLLCVPLHAPWSTTGQVVDFTIAVGARQGFQIHECLLSDFGRTFCEQHVADAAAPYGIDFAHLDPLQEIQI